VPSNILLERFGARRWIARIMISWGIVSAAFAFIPQISAATGFSSEWIFYFLRLLLGACEAGFFPGIIFYLTLWFPTIYRARVISLFMLAIPISSIIGAPISGLLLNLSGAGLNGWQWLFICEALPSALVGFAVLVFLPDFPRQATWLEPDEIKWVQNTLEFERERKESVEHISVLQSLTDSRVLACALVYFCLNAASYGVAFFLPHQGVRRHRHPDRPDRGPALRIRRDRHGAARPPFRQDRRTALPCCRRAGARRRRHRPCRPGVEPGADRRVALHRPDRRLGGAADVLADAGQHPDRCFGRGRHRRDQLAR